MANEAGTTKKKPKKRKRQMEHPKYLDMIVEAIQTMQERKGSSRQAIVKYIRANFKIRDENVEIYVKNALKMGLKYGRLKLGTGRGLSGSFRVGDQKPSSQKKGAGGSTSRTRADTSEKRTKSKPKAKSSAGSSAKSKKAKGKDAKTKTTAKRTAKTKAAAAKKGKTSKKRKGR